MVYLSPVGDQVLSLRLAGGEAHAPFVAVCLAGPHPPVLWHDAIVDGPLEEPKLAGCRDTRQKKETGRKRGTVRQTEKERAVRETSGEFHTGRGVEAAETLQIQKAKEPSFPRRSELEKETIGIGVRGRRSSGRNRISQRREKVVRGNL